MSQYTHFKARGFTVIELVVVIAVIGILAAITTVIYTGSQKDAADRSVQSDLAALDGILSDYVLKHGEAKAWYSPTGIDNDLNFKPTADNVIDVAVVGEEYCIRGFNPDGTRQTFEDAFVRGSSEQACILMDRSTAAGGSGGTIVGWWKLNNDNGKDYSGFGNNATTVANVTSVTGENNYGNHAYSFNGSSSHIEINHSPSLNLTGALTVTAWVKPTTITGVHGIALKDVSGANPPIGNPAYGLQHNDGRSHGYITNASNSPVSASCNSPLLVADQWNLVAQTFDGTYVRTYLDGELCSGVMLQNGGSASTTAPFRIGQQKLNTNRFFAGVIDDVRVYNYALSETAIEDMYAKGAQ